MQFVMTRLLIGILVYYFYYTENFCQFKEKITVNLTDYPSTQYTFLDVKRQLHVSAIKGSHYQAVSNKYLFLFYSRTA